MSDSSGCGDKSQSQLAVEVLWCVQQIEATLARGMLGEKKAKEARISRKKLKNPGTPLVKLRQLMRISCGDYREKMKIEEREIKLKHEKISTGEIRGTRSNFIKKSVSKACDKSEKVEFKFNFNPQNLETTSDCLSEKVELKNSVSTTEEKSERIEFKFNFNPQT